MTAHALVALPRRAIGTAALLLVALGGWRAVEAAAARRAARSPLAVGTLLGPSLRALLDSAGLTGVPARPTVVLYVSDGCDHCQRELARWDSLAAAGALPLDRVPAVLVRLPSTSAPRHALSRFPELTILDVGARIARELRIAVVPTTYWLDQADRVRAVTRGQQSPQEILRHFHDLLRS